MNLAAKAKAAQFTEYQVIIAASLLEGEVPPQYYAKVARVIDDRLNQTPPWDLGLDSTVAYAVNKYIYNLSQSDLNVNSPYNTTKHPGLPPGPIDSPDAAAIQAVLHPAQGSWLYFVTVNKQGLDAVHVEFDPVQHLGPGSHEERSLSRGRQRGRGRTQRRRHGRCWGAGRPGGCARLADRALALARAAPGRVPRAGPHRLVLRGNRVRRAWPGRLPRLTRPGLGGPVTHHAAQAGCAAAARRRRAAGASTLAPPTRCCCETASGSATTPTCPAWWRRCARQVLPRAGTRSSSASGATACSALAALREIGASDIAVAVRSPARTGPLRGVAARLGLDVRLLELGAAVADIAGPGAGADDRGADDAGADDAGG